MLRIAPRATAHSGSKLGERKKVFALPPPEIGEVLSVDSTVTEGDKPVSLALRLGGTSLIVAVSAVIIGMFSVIPVAIFVWLLESFGVDKSFALALAPWLVGGAGLVAGCVAAPIAWGVNGALSACTYVGAEGLARFEWGQHLPAKMMRFEDARLLMKSVRRKPAFWHGKTRIEFDYQWYGRSELWRLFRIRGHYEIDGEASNDPDPAGGNVDYQFALAAERAWDSSLLDRARLEIAENGFFEFMRDPRDSSRRARMGAGWVELVDGKRIQRYASGEVDTVEASGGQVTLRRLDPMRGLGNVVATFPGGAMDNASFFALALREIAKLPVEG